MGDWQFMWKTEHDHEYDLLTYRIHYPSRQNPLKVIENDYLRRKDEKRIPKELLEERKVGPSREIHGRPWVEGTIKRKKSKNGIRVTRQQNRSTRVTPTARYKSNKTERV